MVKAIPTPAPAPTPPVPVPDAVGYGWLIAIISAVVAIAALMFIITRERLQRAAAAKRPSKHVRDPILVSNLKIAPKRVKLGRKTTVTAKVTNVSPTISSFSVVLKIRGIVEAIKEITLDPGQNQEITFTIVKDKPGSYDIDLENSKGIFTINE